MVLRQNKVASGDLRSGAGEARAPRALTHRSIEALRPDAKPYRVKDMKCTGLAIRVASSGLLTWDLAFRISGTRVFK
jgi:hypothetical protein